MEITVKEPHFTNIKNGKKKIEGRLNKNKFATLKKGDIVIWTNNNNSVKTKITKIKKYDSFYELLIFEGIKNVLPNVKSLKEAVDTYRVFYTKKDEEEYKVLSIKIKKI